MMGASGQEQTMKTLATCVLVSLLAAPSWAAARFDLAHLGKIVRVSDPQISPDGRRVAIVVSRPSYADNRHDAQLVLVDVATRAQRPLTHGRRGVSSPRWSPDGERLAFLAPADGKPQVFVLPMGGGDALQLTQSPTGVQQYAWSPDGTQVAYAATDEAPKREGEERFNDSFEVGNDDYLITAPPMPTHLWLVASAGGAPKRLTSGSWSLPVTKPPGSPASPIAWSPDGKQIAMVKVATPHSGDADQASLHVLDVAAGTLRAVTGRARSESHPSFSPDGRQLAYWFPRDGLPRNVNEIHLVPASGGEGRSLTRALDRNAARSIWMEGGKSLLVGANDGTSVGLWIQPLDGPARRIPLGKVCPSSSFWVDVSVGRGGQVAFAGSEPGRPAELYYLATESSPAQRLTDFNQEVAALDLGRSETVQWDGPDGFRMDGVVTYPPDFAPGRKHPLVLYVHGGPRAASKEVFSSRVQLMAARGWVVFEPNYRGSDNLGNAFQSAISGDAGAGPGRDVMSGVELLKKRGFVDETRMAVSGWSYGGYMTTWLLGNYPVWRAAVAGAAVTDFVDQYNLGDANVRRGVSFGGSPWTGRMAAYLEQSPITYAHKIRTPTLILSNTGDYRVTVTQSYKLYHALKDNGVTTKFIAYPMGGHNATDPVRQRDVDRRWIAWLAEYLDPAPKATAGAGEAK
jgi:dipeptidyl aminopeptidase/acylaminoacyl peptidase